MRLLFFDLYGDEFSLLVHQVQVFNFFWCKSPMCHSERQQQSPRNRFYFHSSSNVSGRVAVVAHSCMNLLQIWYTQENLKFPAIGTVQQRSETHSTVMSRMKPAQGRDIPFPEMLRSAASDR